MAIGEEIMSEESAASAQESVQAEEIVTQLTETKELVYTLHGKDISGRLDLRYRTVHAALDIQNCHFRDEVDFKYCAFEQAVNLSGCTFHRTFNSGDETESRTIYRKDLICYGATFKGPATFIGASIEGKAYFKKCTFEDKQQSADFDSVKLEGHLECQEAIFRGFVNFNPLKCDGAGFFSGAAFEGGVDFGSVSFGPALDCKAATFKGSANFNSLKCEGTGFFDGATFENTVDFTRASFGSNIECSQAIFKGSAGFNSLKCEGAGLFNGATFEDAAELAFASFGSNIECTGATFKGSAGFNSLKSEGSGLFDGATFEEDVDLAFASFRQGLWCNPTTFQGWTSLYALKCQGNGDFGGTDFQSVQGADFSFSSFGGNLNLDHSSFSGPLNLQEAQISRELILTAQSFQAVSLYNATTSGLVLDDGTQSVTDDSPFAEGSLDLRGFTFQRFGGSWQQALGFAKEQQPARFSRDPYLQLEQYYESVGNDVQAREVHYCGRLAVRDNANAEGSGAEWSPGRKVTDWFLKVSTGYGVYTGRIVVPILLFIILGIIVFSLLDEVLPVGDALVVKPSEASAASGTPQGASVSEPTVGAGILYSVDRFIPIGLGVEEELEPNQWWSEMYDHVHVIAGWLLIPLFLASWSGLVRSR